MKVNLLQMGRGPGDEGRGKQEQRKGMLKESRCVVYMCQLSMRQSYTTNMF